MNNERGDKMTYTERLAIAQAKARELYADAGWTGNFKTLRFADCTRWYAECKTFDGRKYQYKMRFICEFSKEPL